jgi:hypothetical protein
VSTLQTGGSLPEPTPLPPLPEAAGAEAPLPEAAGAEAPLPEAAGAEATKGCLCSAPITASHGLNSQP